MKFAEPAKLHIRLRSHPAKSPEGTFSLPNIHGALGPKLRKTPEENDVAVAIHASGAISTTAMYVNESETESIFEKAQQQSKAIDKERFDGLLKSHPIERKEQRERDRKQKERDRKQKEQKRKAIEKKE